LIAAVGVAGVAEEFMATQSSTGRAEMKKTQHACCSCRAHLSEWTCRPGAVH
jgi:hypothetical protein